MTSTLVASEIDVTCNELLKLTFTFTYFSLPWLLGSSEFVGTQGIFNA